MAHSHGWQLRLAIGWELHESYCLICLSTWLGSLKNCKKVQKEHCKRNLPRYPGKICKATLELASSRKPFQLHSLVKQVTTASLNLKERIIRLHLLLRKEQSHIREKHARKEMLLLIRGNTIYYIGIWKYSQLFPIYFVITENFTFFTIPMLPPSLCSQSTLHPTLCQEQCHTHARKSMVFVCQWISVPWGQQRAANRFSQDYFMDVDEPLLLSRWPSSHCNYRLQGCKCQNGRIAEIWWVGWQHGVEGNAPALYQRWLALTMSCINGTHHEGKRWQWLCWSIQLLPVLLLFLIFTITMQGGYFAPFYRWETSGWTWLRRLPGTAQWVRDEAWEVLLSCSWHQNMLPFIHSIV